jgi:hypothetical protein
MQEPLIFTSKGNLPVASLKYEYAWFEDDDTIKFVERYLLNGEVVKESAHVKVKKGPTLQIQGGAFG